MPGPWLDNEGILMRGLCRARTALSLAVAAAALAACAGTFNQLGGTQAPTTTEQPPATTVGTGQVRVALILPLSAPGNAGIAATSMKNAAEMALAEFKEPNIQLLVKDDADAARRAARRPAGDRKAPRSSSARCSRNR